MISHRGDRGIGTIRSQLRLSVWVAVFGAAAWADAPAIALKERQVIGTLNNGSDEYQDVLSLATADGGLVIAGSWNGMSAGWTGPDSQLLWRHWSGAHHVATAVTWCGRLTAVANNKGVEVFELPHLRSAASRRHAQDRVEHLKEGELGWGASRFGQSLLWFGMDVPKGTTDSVHFVEGGTHAFAVFNPTRPLGSKGYPSARRVLYIEIATGITRDWGRIRCKPFAVSRDGRFVAAIIGPDTDDISVFDALQGARVASGIPYGGAAAFSRCGRYLFVGEKFGRIRIHSRQSGALLFTSERTTDSPVTALHGAVDGRRLIVGTGDGTVFAWRIEIAPAPKVAAAGRAAIENAWSALLSRDPAEVGRAVDLLARHAEEAVPLLDQRLPTVPTLEDGVMRGWFEQLDSPVEAIRDLARAEFAEGENQSRRFLANLPKEAMTPRQSAAVDELLKTLTDPAIDSAEVRRRLYGIGVLERIAGRESARILNRLAGGNPDSRVTSDAKAALTALKRIRGR